MGRWAGRWLRAGVWRDASGMPTHTRMLVGDCGIDYLLPVGFTRGWIQQLAINEALVEGSSQLAKLRQHDLGSGQNQETGAEII